MGYQVSSLDALGEGYGFRKVRAALGVTAFGVNAIVYPPHYDGPNHYHDRQDELYFVHRGTATFVVDGEERTVEEGGLVHVESTTPRSVSNNTDDELVVLIVGGKDGYVERDGQLVSPEDLAKRQGLTA
jgi:quercetin dioxygenase-like cupin family protein